MRSVLVAVVAVLTACGGATRYAASPPVIAVIEPGGEPRRLVRYAAPALHVPERIEIRLKVRSSVATTNTVLENGRTDVDAPTIRLVVRLEATGATPAGGTRISYEIEEASVLGDLVDPRMRGVLEPEVAALKGVRATWERDPAGVVSQVVLDPATLERANRAGLAGVPDAALQSVVRFPDVPIGTGAIWRTDYDESFGGIHWHTTFTSRVKEISATHVTVELSGVMRAPSQPISVEPNATVRLTSADRSGNQLWVIPLDRLAASGELRERAELNVLVVRGRVRSSATLILERIGFFQPVVPPAP